MTPQVRKFLDLSTAHVCPETRDWLEHETDQGLVYQLTGGYGWMLYCADTEHDPVPTDLDGIFALAKNMSCEYVMLDRDAPIHPDLPTWDW